MDKNYTGKELKNAIVTAYGRSYKIEKVLYAEFWERYGYDIEFIDTSGNYHHWKQDQDCGTIEFPAAEKPKKETVDSKKLKAIIKTAFDKEYGFSPAAKNIHLLEDSGDGEYILFFVSNEKTGDEIKYRYENLFNHAFIDKVLED